MGLPSKSYQILEMSRGKATIGHPWPTSSDLILSMGIAGPGHKSFANMDACNCWHKYPMHMEASNCGYLDASHHGSKPLMRMDASHCGQTDVSYYGRKSLMHMASPNGGCKGASYHGHKSLMHMDAFNFGHTIASYHVYMSLMLMKPSYHHGEKSPMQTDAFCCGHTHTFYHGRKAVMHIDAFIWGCPDAFRCGGRNSSLHTEASNCGHVHTVKSSVPLNNSTPQKILEDGAWEMMNLEEALASLEHKAHCVSVKDFIHILQMCRKKKKLEYAKRVHMHIRNHELEVHEVLGSYLVPTFVECGSVFDADQIFQRLTHRNEYSWTSLIQGYIECGECEHAFNLYHRMQKDGIHPNTYTFQSLLRACVQLKSINRGRDLHFDIAKEGLESHPFVGTALVDMYAKCGSVEEAREVFNELPARDVVVWTALIGGYAEHGLGEQALICLELMQGEGISPNSMTLVCCLKGCCSIGAIDRGREIHASIAIEGLEGDLFIGNALVDMYVKRDLLEDACEVFERMPDRDVVSWTSLIMGYTERGLGEETLVCLERMRQEWVSPNDVTYICSLKACGGSGAVDTGREVHTQVCKEGFERDAIVGNALVDMYAKCGSLSEAWEIFNKLRVRDLVSWSALIAGYARKGESKLAFSLFERMREEGIRPDGVVFLGVLNACSHAGLVLKGQDLFKAMSEEYALSPTVQHYNCMLDLLGRAGQLKAAVAWLDKMPFKPNFVTWSTLLGACQKWGNIELGRRAFDCAVRLDKKQITSFIVMSSIYADAHMWEDAKKIDAMRANIHVEEAGKDLD